MEINPFEENGWSLFSCFWLILLFGGILDEDLEIELVEEEPPFLRGHTKQSMDMSPIKIVKVRSVGTLIWTGQVNFFQCKNSVFHSSLLIRVSRIQATGGSIDCWLGSRIFFILKGYWSCLLPCNSFTFFLFFFEEAEINMCAWSTITIMSRPWGLHSQRQLEGFACCWPLTWNYWHWVLWPICQEENSWDS